MAPRPGPPPSQQRWFQERPSEYPWEQDGLDHIKRLMLAAEPFRAWATFSFTAASGRIHECDLLIAVPGGLYLLGNWSGSKIARLGVRRFRAARDGPRLAW